MCCFVLVKGYRGDFLLRAVELSGLGCVFEVEVVGNFLQLGSEVVRRRAFHRESLG